MDMHDKWNTIRDNQSLIETIHSQRMMCINNLYWIYSLDRHTIEWAYGYVLVARSGVNGHTMIEVSLLIITVRIGTLNDNEYRASHNKSPTYQIELYPLCQ
ncbi:hypothetical protein BDB01DRAFT_386573 [Pilobolus umbonatus]|nr:hypothetical protein BDB01DRAFT_386573 [Pilobolus umbonatus]